jgi:CheY-like chemotaxis protein
MAFIKRDILVVEGNPNTQRMYETILRQCGYHCVFVNNSFDALEMIHKYPFDLVITDLFLTLGSGTDLLKRLKSGATTKSIPVVVACEQNDRHTIEKCISFGAADFLIKPIDRNVLIEKFKRILGGRPRFAEVPFASDDTETGYSEVVFKSHVVSIGESGMVMWSPIPLDEDSVHRVRAKVFAQIGIHSPDLKVAFCQPAESGGYDVYFTFVGLKEADINNVRSWVVDKKLREVSN